MNKKDKAPARHREVLKSREDHLDTKLRDQLGDFLRAKDHLPIPTQNFIKKFFSDFLISRNKRGSEIEDQRYVDFIKWAESLFPYKVYGVGCIDGRVLPVLLGGFVAQFGGFLRIPAGELKEFVDNQQNDEIAELRPYSNFHERLIDAFKDKRRISQILDSHIECAARNKEEKEKLKIDTDLPDHGLLQDVKRKKRIAKGMKKFVNEYFNGKEILPIQQSFNIENGFLYMGLETDDALAVGNKNGSYDKKTINQLVKNNKIISTEELTKQLGKVFQNVKFEPNWENDYVKTAINFWKNIAILKKNKGVTKVIRDKLIQIYPELEDKARADELEQRVMILLANSYNAYYLNRVGYKYSKHREECVVVSELGYSPFNIHSFSVHILDEENIDGWVELAHGLVLKNRKALDRVVKHSDQKERIVPRVTNRYSDIAGLNYENAPVPVAVQHMIRLENKAERKKFFTLLRELDLNRLTDNQWLDIEKDSDFETYLKTISIDLSKPKYFRVRQELVKLRKYVRALYLDPEIGLLLKNNQMIILPMMIDQFRKTQAIIPYVANNFK